MNPISATASSSIQIQKEIRQFAQQIIKELVTLYLTEKTISIIKYS